MLTHPALRVERTVVYQTAGISHTTHDNWVEEGLLAAAPPGKLSKDDALKILVLARLIKQLDSDHGRLAWKQLATEALDGPDRVDVVYVVANLEASLAVTEMELAQAVRDSGLVRVVSLNLASWREGLDRLALLKARARAARAREPRTRRSGNGA